MYITSDYESMQREKETFCFSAFMEKLNTKITHSVNNIKEKVIDLTVPVNNSLLTGTYGLSLSIRNY